MIPPRTWPEGTERPRRWFEARPSRFRPTDPPMPCPTFECGARLTVDVARETTRCPNGHEHTAEALWRAGIRVS